MGWEPPCYDPPWGAAGSGGAALPKRAFMRSRSSGLMRMQVSESVSVKIWARGEEHREQRDPPQSPPPDPPLPSDGAQEARWGWSSAPHLPEDEVEQQRVVVAVLGVENLPGGNSSTETPSIHAPTPHQPCPGTEGTRSRDTDAAALSTSPLPPPEQAVPPPKPRTSLRMYIFHGTLW